MTFLETSFLGARLWIWLFLVFTLLFWGIILVYIFREKIRRQYYNIRYPERLLKIIIHYPNGLYQEKYRVFPDVDHIDIDGKIYYTGKDQIIKKSDFFVQHDKDTEFVNIDGNRYLVTKLLGIKTRWDKIIQLHYFYNNPEPIKFDYDTQQIKFTGEQSKQFKKNDLLTKLLTLNDNKGLFVLMFMLILGNLLISGFMLAKQMGWIE